MPESATRLGRRPAGDALGPSHLATTSLVDTRTGKNTTHRLDGQFRQSIHGRLVGYEEVNDNDADRLALDPVCADQTAAV